MTHTRRKPRAPLTRREAVGLLGAGAAGTLLGLGRPGGRALAQGQAGCIVRPAQTEGPYFVDERLERSDLRADPSDGSTKPGVPLRLGFRVAALRGARCAPLAGALVDVWQCDAQGVYSDVEDRRFQAQGKKFLRGYQRTDAQGGASFLTLYPGSYPGRAVHVHFKIRLPAAAAGPALEFTSQLYFEDAVTDRVLSRSPYQTRGRWTRNADDGIFEDGGSELLLSLAPEAEGYAATFDIALESA
jgi:protocatechuate 3,4-dioxygenase beta subunit